MLSIEDQNRLLAQQTYEQNYKRRLFIGGSAGLGLVFGAVMSGGRGALLGGALGAALGVLLGTKVVPLT